MKIETETNRRSIYSVLDRIESQQPMIDPKRRQPENVEIGPNDLSIDLLQAVYRNNALDLHIRMRAALGAIAFETPKLLATAVINEQSFAELLDRRLKKVAEMRADNQKVVNGTATPTELELQSEPRPERLLPQPLARIYTNKFRRRI